MITLPDETQVKWLKQYLLIGTGAGITCAAAYIVFVSFSYFMHSYPLNWLQLPFDFIKSRDFMLFVHMSTSSFLIVLQFAVFACLVWVAVKFIFGLDVEGIGRQVACSLSVVVLCMEGDYLIKIIYITSASFRKTLRILDNAIYNFFPFFPEQISRLTVIAGVFLALYALSKAATKVMKLFMRREKVESITLAVILTSSCLAVIHSFTGFNFFSIKLLHNTGDLLFFITILAGAILSAILIYKGSLNLLYKKSGADQAFQTTGKIKSNLVKYLRCSVLLYVLILLFAGLSLLINSKAVEVNAGDRESGNNIILITIDALRPDHLSCYGYSLPTSPNIDAIAERSSLFTSAVSVSPFTAGSVPGMLTSMYPEQVDFERKLRVSGESITLPILLQKNGYETAAFVGNYVLKKSLGLSRGFYIYDDNLSGRELHRNFPEETAESLTRKVIDWLKVYHQRSFFLWIHYQDPHGPYTPPPPFDSVFARGRYNFKGPLKLLENNSGYGGIPRYQILNNETDPNYYVAQYDGEINYVDHNIGILMTELKRLGQYDETTVIITADHGEAMVNDGGYFFCHGHALREELIKVPLIIKLPQSGHGKTVSTQVSSLDIAPTILELTGISEPGSMMGESLINLIRGGQYKKRYAFSHKGRSTAIRTNNYKLISDRSGLRLFDIVSDTKEANNLSREPDEKQLVEELLNETKKHLQRIKTVSLRYRKTKLDRKTRNNLKSLGYID